VTKHPAPGGVLALDLGGTIGWSYGPIEMRHPVSGHVILRVEGEIECDRFMRASNAVYELLEKHGPTTVIVEAPLNIAAMNGDRAARQQLGLVGVASAEIARYGLRPLEFSADLVRYELLGRQRFPKGTVKDHVWAWCRANGYRPEDHNEADSIALWAYYAGQLRRGLKISREMLIDDVD
jgi:Holliday junction resolvasome RuvABC endonuclease subunit